MVDSLNKLDLGLFRKNRGIHALSREAGQHYAHAASVCLEECSQSQGCVLEARGLKKKSYRIYWPKPTSAVLRTWRDPNEATEWGAVVIAILLLRDLTGCKVIERSYRPTGFDFWLGDAARRPFHRKARLEVSGIRRDTEKEIRRRVKAKCEQTKRTMDSGLPAFVAVVEFSGPVAEVVKR